MTILEKIVDKSLGARFVTFIMVIGTLCYATIQSVNAVFGILKVDPAIKDLVEKIAMFILGAFVPIATGMYKEYYDRNDRNGNGKSDYVDKTKSVQ